MELEKTSKQELSSLSSLRSITPPNERRKKKKKPSEICRIKLINVVHSTILATKKQDMDFFFSFFFFSFIKTSKEEAYFTKLHNEEKITRIHIPMHRSM
jgi:hypothetical protein